MDYKLSKFRKFSDNRGDLVVFLKNSELDLDKKKFGQIYFVSFNKKGVVRGNHYHKRWSEWFGVVSGKVKVVLRDIRTGENCVIILNEKTDRYTRLAIGPYIGHSFKSLTRYAALINYADSQWSAKDTYAIKLL